MERKLLDILLVLITVGLNAAAQTLLKLGANRNPINPYLLGGIGAYGLSTLFYILVLGKHNLSIIYPIVIGLTIAATTIAGANILQEKVSLTNWLAVGLIVSGVLALALKK